MRVLLILHISLLSSVTSLAQYISINGTFSIDNQRGCRNLIVVATNTIPPPSTDVVLYQFEGLNSTPTSDSTYTYTNSGNFWLYRYIQNDPIRTDSILVEVVEPIVPEIELKSCNGQSVQVEINNTDYDLYEINYGDGSIVLESVGNKPPIYTYANNSPVNVSVTGLYTTANNTCGVNSVSFTPVNQVQPASISLLEYLDDDKAILHYTLPPNTINTVEVSVNNTSNYQLFKNINQGSVIDTLTNLQLRIASYCFRITSNDACSNFQSYSNELCTIYTEAESVSDAIELDWNTIFAPGYTNVNINRDSQMIDNLSGFILDYTDTTVICKNTYTYTIETVYSNGSRSRSNEVSELAFSNTIPDPVSNISAQFNTNQINWYWTPPPAEQVKYYSVFSNSITLTDSTTNTSIATEWSGDERSCLQINLTNICDLPSGLSQPVCPLEISNTINSDGSITLSWTEYTGWNEGVEGYYVLKYDGDMNPTDSLWLDSELEYTDPLPDDNEQVNYFQVWASPTEFGVLHSSSNLVEIIRPPIIAIPNSFTPNGDNINDVFSITGKFIQSIELTILNRWGSTIYNVNGSSWDGMIGDKKAPLGTYIYNVVIKDFAGKEHIRTGTVLILKD